MRRLLRFVVRGFFGVCLLILAVVAFTFAVHRMQLHRLRQLAQYPVQRYVTETSPYFVLSNVNVIDGTGKDELKGESIVVRDGKIAWIGPTAAMPTQPGTKVIDLRGATVIPGLVMMHEHLFTSSQGNQLAQQSIAFPLLYLAAGVTTARTAGSIDPGSDLRTKSRIDKGEQVGPELFLTAPYLEGSPATYRQMHALTDADDAKRSVDRDIAQGFTSIKAYANITPEELQAAITEAHAKSVKITGHLCSVTYSQAAELGIDNLEHGLLTDTEFYSAKKPNICPDWLDSMQEYRDKLDVSSPAVTAMMDSLISRHVALTSTLPVEESELVDDLPDWYREHDKTALIWRSWWNVLLTERFMRKYHFGPLMDKERHFEAEFIRRGGTLLAGSDPTGDRATLAGFGDLWEIELLNRAGLTPVQAIQVATLNGATFLNIADRVGSIELGKQADLVVIDGDPAQHITDIRNVKTVFRQGKGYDSKKMMDDVVGVIGLPN